MKRIVFDLLAAKNVLVEKANSSLSKLREDKGATAVEYALIVGLIAIVIIAAVTLLGENISNAFSRAACVIKGGTWNTTSNTCS
jgi:pilus assembly protein Flp/PilA